MNADNVVAAPGGDIRGYNLYSYCFNNPVNMSDLTGNWPKLVKSIANVVKKVVNVIKKAGEVQHDVPLYNQGRLSLCWAYCQTMVEDFQTSTTKTQEEANVRAREIAVSEHGETDWNQGGWPTNMGDWYAVNSFVDLFQEVIKGPIYGYYAGDDGAHLIVITGANLWRGEIYTNNLWGISGIQTYDEFLSCFAGGPITMPFVSCILIN